MTIKPCFIDEFFGFPLVTPIEAPPQKVAKFGPVRLAVSHQGTSIPTRISSEIQKANRRHVEVDSEASSISFVSY